jgi:hypothetical protein
MLADFVIGQHLTLTGTFVLQGIQSPISPGDNFQYNETVYHIEQVAHSCSIGSDGHKEFHTILHVNHGLSSEKGHHEHAGMDPDDHVTEQPLAISDFSIR